MKIEGKVAIVIGGATGIGRASCKKLLDRGAKVILADICEDEGRKTVDEFWLNYNNKIHFFKCDVAKTQNIQEAFETAEKLFGDVNIVLNNAAIIDEFNWENCLNVNVAGCIRCADIARKRMGKINKDQEAVVVFVSSISGLRAEDWGPVYSASKHAVVAYTRSLALPKQYNLHGIRFNTLCPTSVRTNFLQQVLKGYFAEDNLAYLQSIEASKLTPEYVAEAFIKLVEDDNLNGEAMQVTSAGYNLTKFIETILQ